MDLMRSSSRRSPRGPLALLTLTLPSLTLRRMGAHRLVLSAVLLTTLISAAVAAALATFATQALSQAVGSELAAAPNPSLAISGTVTSSQAASDTTAIKTGIRSALGHVPFAFYRAVWSDSLALPVRGRLPPPGAAGVPLTQAAAADAVEAHAVLLSGSWPGAPRPGQPVPAAVPAATARLLRLAPGDVLSLRDRVNNRPVRIRLTGVFRPRDLSGHASEYWELNTIGPSGVSSVSGFTTYGPLVVDPAAFGHSLVVDGASWVVLPDTAHITGADLGTLAGSISQEQQYLQNPATLGGLTVTTSLPALLSGMATDLGVARSLLAIGALQLLLLTAGALAVAARLLASQRDGESALLSARGGARWQLARLNAAEAAALAAIAAGGGGLAGGRLAAVLAGTGPLRAAGLRLSGITAGAWWAVAATAVLGITIMLGPALRPASPPAVRVRRGRQAVISGVARAGADLALVALAVLTVWQLRRYSAATPSVNGTLGVDPVLAVAPALALAAGTAVLLRVLPVAARGGDRLASRGRRLSAAFASWQISRRPVRQAGPPLLVVLAVATGTLALAQHQSWLRSASDQAAFTAGADVRVDTPEQVTLAQAAAIAAAPRVRSAMPVAQLNYGSTEKDLAVDARGAADTVALRADESPLPLAALFRKIIPAGAASGVAMPGHPARAGIVASLGPASLRLAPVTVTLTIQDADNDAYLLPAGTLQADGRAHSLTASLPAQAMYPLRLTAVTLDYTLPAAASSKDAMLTVTGIAAPATAAGAAAAAPGTALGSWTPAVSSQELANLQQAVQGVAGPSGSPAVRSWLAAGRGAQTLAFAPGFGEAFSSVGPPSPLPGQLTLTPAAPGISAIPGIATQEFLSSGNTAIGSTVQVDVSGITIPVKIVAAVTAFPTVSGPGGALIVDLARIQDILASMSLPPAQVREWWLATSRPPPGLPADAVVTTRARLTARLLDDPLSAAPQQALLAIAVAAAVLAAAGFSVSIAASVSQRRPQSALLSALGVSRTAQAMQLCLEELMLSMPSAAVGLALGALLARLVVPAVTLTTGGAAPVPPALTEFAWAGVVPLALAVATLPVIAAAATVARRPDPAAQLRATESA